MRYSAPDFACHGRVFYNYHADVRMKLRQILSSDAIIFGDEETDIPITRSGEIDFGVFAEKFNGDYGKIGAFHHEVKIPDAAKALAAAWFQEHSTFNPGP